eukprot:6544825-Alexandrium_andersonii.AAC.1
MLTATHPPAQHPARGRRQNPTQTSLDPAAREPARRQGGGQANGKRQDRLRPKTASRIRPTASRCQSNTSKMSFASGPTE